MNRRIWLITGGGNGLGRALAMSALERGDIVAVTDLDVEAASRVAALHPDRALALRLDVTDSRDVAEGVAVVRARYGRIDVVVNSAGYGLLAAVEEAGEAEVRQLFEVNFFGTVRVLRATLPVLREQRSGHIVNVSSVGGRVSHPLIALYSASKFAVEGLGGGLAAEVGHLGIHVTTVAPGGFATNFAAASVTAATAIADYETVRDAMRPVVASAAQGTPADFARAVLTIVDSDAPPLRFAAGEDAHELIAASLAAEQEELQRWESLSRAASTTSSG